MGARFRPDPGLDVEVARAFALPEVLTTEAEIREAGQANAPVDTGRLRYEIEARPAEQHGTRVHGTVDSHAINPEDGYDYAAINELQNPTRPRYMGRAARSVAARRGHRTGPGGG